MLTKIRNVVLSKFQTTQFCEDCRACMMVLVCVLLTASFMLIPRCQTTPIPLYPTVSTLDVSTEQIAVGTWARPVISIDATGTVWVAVEGSNMKSIWVYRLQGGTWQGGQVVVGSKQTADRVYVPDAANGVVSFRYGPKNGGTIKGPGLWINNTEIATRMTTGAARLDQDDQGIVLMSKDANWGRVNADGTIGKQGHFANLSTGEKLAFDCVGPMWAVGMNGYSAQDASVAVGTSAGGKVTAVADYHKYSGMSSDLLYCSVVIRYKAVWFASAYGGRLMVNCVKDGKARWPIAALANLGPCVTGDRCAPALVNTPASVVAIYEAPGRAIMRQAVPNGGALRIATGSQPDATVGPGGAIHMVWIDGNVLRYRVL